LRRRCSRISLLGILVKLATAAMQHRGIEFKVVKTRPSAGWMWVVEVGKTEKVVGTHYDRDGAIRRAKKFIDELVSKREQDGR
jgi:hypothetical protein